MRGVHSAPLPALLRGEVGLRSNPGEGHGTTEAATQVYRTHGSVLIGCTTRVAAPHPDPLPVKNGERGRTCRAAMSVATIGARMRGMHSAPLPALLRGEVGLRSNPGEGHGTYGAASRLSRIRRQVLISSGTTRVAAPHPSPLPVRTGRGSVPFVWQEEGLNYPTEAHLPHIRLAAVGCELCGQDLVDAAAVEVDDFEAPAVELEALADIGHAAEVL
ncbi:hypothetical protein ACVILH_001048 [Bradyrhizobium sp. USDA 4353]